jgi:hypothetical protein
MRQQLPSRFAFPAAYIGLAVILMAGSYLAAYMLAPDTVVRVKTEVQAKDLGDVGAVREGLGDGSQPVPCDSLNIPAELKCEAWERPDSTVILVTAGP